MSMYVFSEVPGVTIDLFSNSTIQIGINLSDAMFQGHYHGKQAHESDLDDVIQRAKDVGCEKFMVTGSDLEESQTAIQIARDYREFPN